jgi:hypothetical protein
MPLTIKTAADPAVQISGTAWLGLHPLSPELRAQSRCDRDAPTATS